MLLENNNVQVDFTVQGLECPNCYRTYLSNEVEKVFLTGLNNTELSRFFWECPNCGTYLETI